MMRMNQTGKANPVTVALVCFIGFVVLVVTFLLNSYFSYGRKAVGYEEKIKAQSVSNGTYLSSCTVAIANMAKIPNQYVEAFKSIIKTDQEGRYGKDTIQRVTQFMNERNLNFNDKMFSNIQDKIEACENGFDTKQNQLTSLKSAYSTELRDPWSGTFYRMHGYPTIKIDDYKVIMDSDAKTQMDTGVRKGYDTSGK